MVIEQKHATLQSFDPATKKLLGEVPLAGASDVEKVVSQAWQAYESWRDTSYKERAQKLLALKKIVAERCEQIAELVTKEVGKPLYESYLSEIYGVLESCTWFAENTEKSLSDQTVAMTNPLLLSKQSIITFEPLGVVGIISPWNYPFAIPMMATIMAVATGNTVVLKPSEKCPLVGILIGELFQKAGFPDYVVTIVTGDRETGAQLVQSELAKLIFTGSVQGGIKVAEKAAAKLTPVSLELGGKDAAIVLADANVDWTADGLVWSAFTNCGQACASIERLYIVRGANTDKLIEAIVEKTKKLKIGSGLEPNTDLGPMIDESQLAKVEAQVEKAKAQGAKVLTGGKRREDLGGWFYEPTVLTNVNHKMEIMQEETFGPVLPIIVVESENEAVELANDSEFGLCASIWTGNLANAEEIAASLDVGTVLINDALFSFACPQVPWGGLKKSGTGRTHSYFGLLDLVNIKHISIDSAGGMHRLWWYPYGKPRITVAKSGIDFLHGADPVKKIFGMFDFAFNFFRKAKP